MRGLVTALRTLTVIPVPGKEGEHLSDSLPWFPVAGLALGALFYLLARLWLEILGDSWSSGGGALILFETIILTRGLHLDGLADWADALGIRKGRKQRLAVMKDPHLGSFGVLALISLLLLKWAALSRLLASGSILWLLAIGTVSRGMMVELITTLPYARSGEGTARPFLEGARPKHRFLAFSITLALCLWPGPVGLVLFGAGWIVTHIMRYFYKKGFGGITGDLLGANCEIVETVLLFLCALPGERLLPVTGWSWLQ
ncbi:MAG: adenosylcobinamide-GDP ribazoletransferase [Deltaproteobacteria bacterium]|nr:adenosylcobinamide-GDP ribazoletransferase [Deltaproteobacteria bacterium]MBW2015631.1 adenosylcobinamide-GDP ribazoletransferase [Deltaproteobacteria bacterium]MBW2129776.1 adenosylcobinamide-GDP ribazoletransferase [Deltaproteobacteria bacterium]MBW2302492.1 adenosylcobinamide-GDP ribazoletransferase [Deltaproteobacteria bacterium]